ncbi:hypothetical protein AVEN_143257-1 [Araneus ventricosus]|uniref:Uncharacterized protein n=1 Tax=Araneus ventricosus TaxID=182803 RepID=A0A4Y2ADI9_ARAVE|nr:hypothetical protein AVEN_143257-1 [Araneus ventricosus]
MEVSLKHISLDSHKRSTVDLFQRIVIKVAKDRFSEKVRFSVCRFMSPITKLSCNADKSTVINQGFNLPIQSSARRILLLGNRMTNLTRPLISAPSKTAVANLPDQTLLTSAGDH